MVPFRTLIWRAIGRSTLLTRATRRLAPNPFDFMEGKPLERWLMTYDLGDRSLALANDPAVVETVMQDRAGNFPKSATLHALLQPLIGSGVFGQPGGTAVKETRKLYSRALSAIPDETVAEVTRAVTERYMKRWQCTDALERLPICTELARLTVDIVALCTLGTTFDPDESERFAALFFEYHRRAVPLLLLLSEDTPDGHLRSVRHMQLASVGAALRALIRERFVAPLLSGELRTPAAPFAATLRAAGLLTPSSDPRGPAADPLAQRALDEIAVMLLAGHETTASVLSWLLWELAQRRDTQDELALRLLDGGQDAKPDDSRPNTTSPADDALKATIKEALRLYPPIAFFLRDTCEPVVFREKPIAAGSFFVIAPWTLHRHRKHWSQPDAFLPERWLGSGPACPRAAFIPFGMGPRTCPGAHFADIETQEIMRTLLKSFRFAPAMRDRPKPLGSLTSRPDREIYLQLTPRIR